MQKRELGKYPKSNGSCLGLRDIAMYSSFDKFKMNGNIHHDRKLSRLLPFDTPPTCRYYPIPVPHPAPSGQIPTLRSCR